MRGRQLLRIAFERILRNLQNYCFLLMRRCWFEQTQKINRKTAVNTQSVLKHAIQQSPEVAAYLAGI